VYVKEHVDRVGSKPGWVPARLCIGSAGMTTTSCKAGRVFNETMATPKGIPIEKAKCVVTIPGEEKAAFLFGGNYSQAVATCRTGSGSSAQLLVAIGGERCAMPNQRPTDETR
jgi:hypothetical protein